MSLKRLSPVLGSDFFTLLMSNHDPIETDIHASKCTSEYCLQIEVVKIRDLSQSVGN